MEFQNRVYWKLKYCGIKAGMITITVYKNRLSFIKSLMYNNEEDLQTALKILKEKLHRIIHIKNPNILLRRLAEYCIDSEIVTEETDLI